MAEPASVNNPQGKVRTRLGTWLLPAALLLMAPGCGLLDLRPPLPPEGTDAFGTFRHVQGVGVLTLWGDPYQRGRAHGRLLAPGVLEMVDTLCGTNLLISRHEDYERVILPLVDRFVFDPADEQELQGILDGVREQLGPKAVLKRIGRPLTLRDLKAYNTAGDWYRKACSSFAAWGGLTQDGHVWVGRNFDFVPAKAFYPNQMILVHRPLGSKKAWATVTEPGMIGCITGVNADGVFTATHDAFLGQRPLAQGYVPRLLVLRRLMETVSARDLEGQALPLLEASPQMFDSSILLAAPVRDGTPPALVLECGADHSRDSGVTVRRPQDNETPLGREAIACTNNFRKRAGPPTETADYRYSLIRQILRAKANKSEPIGFDLARKVMGSVRLPITVHTVIVDLSTLDLWFAAGEFLLPPGNRDYVRLPLKKWLTDP
jgi:hypothetical protein